MEGHKELIPHNELSLDTKKSMKSRILVGPILFVIIIPLLILGDYFFFCLIIILLGISTYEIIKAPQNETKKYSIATIIFTYLINYGVITLILFANNKNNGTPFYDLINGFSHIELSLVSLVLIIVPYFLLVIFDKKFEISDALYFISFDILLILGFSTLLFLRFLPIYDLIKSNNGNNVANYIRFGTSIDLILYMAIGVCLNDIFAYFFGVLFGKHKMCPNLSPKKTWEGFFGGVISSFIFSFLFGILLAYFNNPLAECLSFNRWYNILLLSLIMPLIGTLGDLIFSAIKRHYGVKDFGTILKSHGGALDRLDSILISSFVISCLIHLMTLSL